MRTPKARPWTDPKTGKLYLRVRSSDANGRSVARLFTEPRDAAEYVATLVKERKRHGRAAAVNSDEIDALRVWREYCATESASGREAPALRDVIRDAIKRLKTGNTTPSLEALYKRFIDTKEREELSRLHLVALKSRLGRLLSYFSDDTPSGSVTAEDVARALASMRAAGLSPQTVKGIRSAAHGMFEWGLGCGLISTNPVARTKPPKVTLSEVGIITASQLRGLLLTALEVVPRAIPMLAVAAFCGVRRAELCRLRFEDLDLARAELRISPAVAKTGVARFIPIPAALVAWLQAAEARGVAPIGRLVPGGLKSRAGGGPVTDDTEAKAEGQLNRWMREIRGAAGLPAWPHNALRHSFASHAAAFHGDFAKVATWLGHARDPRLLVARYRHAVREEEGAAWFSVLPGGGAAPITPATKARTRHTA